MIDEKAVLQQRFSELLHWERSKRREKIVAEIFFYSLLAAVAAIPARELLPHGISAWYLPALFFVILAPGFFLLRRWGDRETLRAVFLLDKTLRLEERALTAWEILGRKEREITDRLVLEEAGERLRAVDPRSLFKRQLTWHALFAPPILLLWLLLVWFDFGVHFDRVAGKSASPAVAEKLREFSRDLQHRAEAQGLAESLKLAQALEEVAEKSLRGEIDEKRLSENLSGMAGRIEEMGQAEAQGSDPLFSTATREALLDFKAELETLKPLRLPDFAGRESGLREEILRRLGALPRLREEIERALLSEEKLDERALQRFLNRLDKGVAEELDRRTLLEIKDFLALLLQGAEGQERAEFRGQGQAGEGWLSRGERIRGKGGLPGDQPGTKGESAQASSPLPASAATHLKGLLGEGKSGSLVLRGEAGGRASEVSPDEIVSSYRRKAEEEITSEKIPEGLREIIKNYFLSLGMGQGKKD